MNKTILLPHFSDTIAEGDVTLSRLKVQYGCIIAACINKIIPSSFELIRNLNYEPLFIGSEFGNSEETANQVLGFIDFLSEKPEARGEKVVICANNASRAKHEKQEHAKGSDCLLSQIKSPEGKEIYVVGVDDEVFRGFAHCTIGHWKVTNIRWNGKVKNDISQGSQFRSLEYRPLVQFILATYSQDEWINYLDFEKREILANESPISTIAVNDSTPSYYRKFSGKINIDQKLPQVVNEGDGVFYDTATQRQLIGQRELFTQQRGVEFDTHEREELVIRSFNNCIERLEINELIFIGRDKFGNAKCISKHKDGVIGIVGVINSQFGQTIEIHNNGGKIGEFCLTQSLGKETGKNCLRNGSSRGPGLHQLVELGHSYGADSDKRENNPTLQNLDTIAVGTKLTIKVKENI